jgi:hypothetical protein
MLSLRVILLAIRVSRRVFPSPGGPTSGCGRLWLNCAVQPRKFQTKPHNSSRANRANRIIPQQHWENEQRVPAIKSQLLCQLSYAPIFGWSFSPWDPLIATQAVGGWPQVAAGKTCRNRLISALRIPRRYYHRQLQGHQRRSSVMQHCDRPPRTWAGTLPGIHRT